MITGLDEPATLNCPWTESPFFEREFARRQQVLSATTLERAASLHEQGYAIWRHAIPDELLDRVRAEVEPFYAEPEVMASRRIQDAWSRGASSVRELAVYRPIQDLLRVLYERNPIPFQTLNFKWGTEQ